MPRLQAATDSPGFSEPHPLITAELDFLSLTYTVTIDGLDPSITVHGQSMAEALHEAANQLAILGHWNSDRFDPNATTSANMATSCKYCDGHLFFAETVNGKIMPLDIESVQHRDLIDVAGYLVSWRPQTGIGPRSRAQARRAPQQFQGEVWVPHPAVCGATAKAPVTPPLFERWERNRGVSLEAEDRARRELIEWLSPASA